MLQEDIRLSVAGRTDAGVHARGQVASFTTSGRISPERIKRAVNARLGPEVVAVDSVFAPDGFDARFSASAREYRYAIETSEVPDPFTARFEWHLPAPLAVASMRHAARPLLGEHDFASFCRHPGKDRPTIRNLQRASIARKGSRIILVFRANAFLHQMVRSLVGTLVAVGRERLAPDEVGRILAARDRRFARADLAPAQGLTLERVVYGSRVARAVADGGMSASAGI